MENISIDKIIDQWTSKKIKLSPPSTIDAIKVTEHILNFQFPDDFKEFYLNLMVLQIGIGQKICFQFGHWQEL